MCELKMAVKIEKTCEREVLKSTTSPTRKIPINKTADPYGVTNDESCSQIVVPTRPAALVEKAAVREIKERIINTKPNKTLVCPNVHFTFCKTKAESIRITGAIKYVQPNILNKTSVQNFKVSAPVTIETAESPAIINETKDATATIVRWRSLSLGIE